MVIGIVCLANGRRLSGVVSTSIPRHVTSHSQARLLSTTILQRTRPSIRHQLHALPGNSRNLWGWSSKAPAIVASQDKITEEQVAVAHENLATSSTPVQPPAETSDLVDSTNIVNAVPDVVTAPSTGLPVDVVSSAPVDALTSLSTIPPPLHYGDFVALGLSRWTPAGFCQWGIETLQVFSGMPWFWTIVTATALSRVILFPFAVMGLRNTAKMAPHQKQISDLRDEMTAAQKTGNTLKMQAAVLKQRVLYEKIGVSMGGMMLPVFMQLPVTLGMFFGVKNICELPVEQLKYSGVSFLPDLTVADPTYILPIAATLAINAQLSLSARDMASSPNVGHMINLFRGLSFLGFFWMMTFPSGITLYLLSSVVVMGLQSLVLRNPSVRRMLGIPVISAQFQNKSHSMLDSIKYARESWNKKLAEQKTTVTNTRRR